LCAHLAAQCVRVDVVDERALAVDLDHRQPITVAGFELGVASDVDLLELERKLSADALDDPPRTLAQMAALGAVEGDSRDRCRGWW
jgi:hypothetical protein